VQNLQDIFNLLPNFNVEEMIRAFSVKSNDYMYVLYICSLIKSVISLHSLINNKIQNKEHDEDLRKEEADQKRIKEEEAKEKAETKAADK